MRRLLALLLLAAGILLLGCSKEVEPYSESIPEIPPGRSAAGDGGPSGVQPAMPSPRK